MFFSCLNLLFVTFFYFHLDNRNLYNMKDNANLEKHGPTGSNSVHYERTGSSLLFLENSFLMVAFMRV